MRSKAAIKGHPIHPMLVAFPIALYTATLVTLLAYVGTDDLFWYRAALAANVGGVIMAGFAVIPGVIDLLALPRDSAAYRTGIQHAGFNVIANLVFLVNALVLWRSWDTRVLIEQRYMVDATIPLALAVLGVVALVIAGTLGWKLVQTHHVGISDVGDERATAWRYDSELEPWVPPRRAAATTGRQVVRHHHATLRGVPAVGHQTQH